MRKLLLIAAAAIIAGCASAAPKADVPPETLLTQGKALMAKGSYADALTTFRDLLASRPPADLRIEAQFLAGQSAFRAREYAEARSLLKEFLSLFPTHPLAGDAAFAIAESHYLERNKEGRDVTPVREARRELILFLRDRPGHGSTARAKEILADCERMLVAHELNIAEHDMKRGAWSGAAERLSGILREFPSPPGEERIRALLVEAQEKAGR